MRKLNDSIIDGYCQVDKMNWEKTVKDFADETFQCLHDDVTDIINVRFH